MGYIWTNIGKHETHTQTVVIARHSPPNAWTDSVVSPAFITLPVANVAIAMVTW